MIESLRDAYDAFKAQWWTKTTQSPGIIIAAPYALRTGKLGLTASRVVLAGLSQTQGVTRRFITHSSKLWLLDSSLPLERCVLFQSGGEALLVVLGAEIIELLGKSGLPSVRLPCSVSGHMRDTLHRRPHIDSFRVYEVVSMAHCESKYLPETNLRRWSVTEPNDAQWITFANSSIYHAVIEAVVKWTGQSGVVRPPSATLDTIDSRDEIIRAEHGNGVGCVITIRSMAPLARFIAATPRGRPSSY